MSWIFTEVKTRYNSDVESIIGPVDEYINNKIDEIYTSSPPERLCYIVKVDNQIAGMGAFRKLRDDIAEIKRMYVKPNYRGLGLGKQLVQKLLEKIKEFQYSQVYLDTGLFMEAAQGLYRKMGFVEREEYPETEVPEDVRNLWIFMEKKL